MAASDNLSEDQFPETMPVKSLLKMRTVEGRTAAYHRNRKHGDLGDPVNGHEYRGLMHAMRDGGPESIPPVHVMHTDNGPVIGNGLHRIAYADWLGWKSLRVTPNGAESGHDQPGSKLPGI